MAEVLFNAFVVMLFVSLNGFFVAAEFAIVKVRHTQIEPLVKRGDLRARMALEIVSHLDAYLSATQLGITMTSLALGWIGEPFVAHMLEPLLEAVGITDPQWVQGLSFGVAFSLITFLHIVLGELAPKSLAIQKAQGTTLFIAAPLKLFYAVFRPIIWALNTLANWLLKLIGIRPASEADLVHSEEELRLILSEGTDKNAPSRTIALNAIDFKHKQARHVMVPRKEMAVLDASAPASVNISLMQSNKYSRYPVFRETVDNIIGLVHTKDIFKHNRHLDPGFKLESVYRDAILLPETASLEKVLDTMLQKKKHMIILVDEYGGTAGLITLENVLEEIVGNIQDEFDREAPEIVRVNDNEFIVDGSWTTNDVERLLDRELSVKDILSIGGFVIEQLGRIPAPGESFQIADTMFIAEKVENNVVETVRIRRLPPPPVESEP